MSLENEAANMKDILLLTKLYRSHIAILCGVHAAIHIPLLQLVAARNLAKSCFSRSYLSSKPGLSLAVVSKSECAHRPSSAKKCFNKHQAKQHAQEGRCNVVSSPCIDLKLRAHLANIMLDKVVLSLLPLNSYGLRPLEALADSLS